MAGLYDITPAQSPHTNLHGVAASIPHAFTTVSFIEGYVSKNDMLLQSNVAKRYTSAAF